MIAVLVAAAVIAGVASAWVMRRTTDRDAMRRSWKRLQAHFLEFRLFFDEPRLVWAAQVGVLRENARLFARLLPGMLILALPMTWLLWQLDAMFGLRPLHAGEATVVTAQLTRPIQGSDRFEARGSGVAVDTPAVRVFHDRQVCWRVRAIGDTGGSVTLRINGVDSSQRVGHADIDWMIWFAAISSVAAIVGVRWRI